MILKNISLFDRIWSLWLICFAHSPPNFIFWLGRLIFSVSINLHPDNIYTQSSWSNTECKTPDYFPTNLTVTSGVIFSTRPGIYNCISFSLMSMSIIMWSSWWQCVPSQFVNIIGILTAILVISGRDATSVGIKFNVLLTIYVGFHIFQEV